MVYYWLPRPPAPSRPAGVNMYTYQVGYSSYEEAPSVYLTHEIKFDKEEFHQMVVSALEEIVRRWAAAPPQAEDQVPYDKISQFSDLVPGPLSDFLIAERGFKKLVVTADTIFDGWASVLPPVAGSLGWPTSSYNTNNQAVTRRLLESGLDSEITRKNEALAARWEEEL